MNASDLSPDEFWDMLINLNLDTARKLHPNFTDMGLLGGLHKTRYEIQEIDPALRHESAWWLWAHGMGRIDGAPLLPIGRLP